VAIGDLSLGDLQPGQWRDLTPIEHQTLLTQRRIQGPGHRLR
jgi:16S rRNA U516 pseudouridylate synthase RsuA-like enzyme